MTIYQAMLDKKKYKNEVERKKLIDLVNVISKQISALVISEKKKKQKDPFINFLSFSDLSPIK